MEALLSRLGFLENAGRYGHSEGRKVIFLGDYLGSKIRRVLRIVPEEAPPGHYAIHAKTPAPLQAKVACLDYGMGKGGFLCAYRRDGEHTLDAGSFVTIDSP